MSLKKKTVKRRQAVKSKAKKSDLEKEADRILKNQKSKKRKIKPSKRKMYFGPEAHAAIVEYQEVENREEKNKIYEEKIKFAFEKLSENLIYIHNFSTDRDHFHILKSDTVSFLFEILEKFDKEKGAKAFSYFNVCAKNFLIIKSKKRIKNLIRHVRIDDKDLSLREKYAIERHQIVPSPEVNLMNEEALGIQRDLMVKIREKLTNKNEILCMDAAITLYDKVDDLDFLNKRALFVYLREISGLNPKQLSVAMSNIRKHYKELIKNSHEFDVFRKHH